ncbi:MAG: UDP-N-acetylmuramoyl-L-alanine--D-glutamate ligase [Rhodospirillaceae bacterium]|nr:UDP-N-acetylmuramoyl-L-alanine--D-glutamate ligase [Rhodospirillaceae bacterium]MBT5944609.1 UDP-N-acetylmuramoyl-L-alanine--D-glutamate ligase [Rhodospirillaceae bacterium]MBT6405087.1 UDP-N-acetylmuramoyl-L-alanine--D-glutamate ligase [Rhodospirillaceae bacterium]MBT6536666.1 UDP-N-acetylmuramoyl-L-alanine--D-glutamate ligase [Rhodospirillaceae bacterium]MBT7362501.1 UDP-N-acetylmuramoyl-L-alanine--D-glutamate ligase [Rhodospirillaceae bacterium]
MLDLGAYDDHAIAVLGLGVSGMSAASELRRAGARVLPWDDNENRRNGAAARGLTPCDLETAEFTNIDMLVLSPGIPQGHPHTHPVVARAREAGCEILCDVELLTRAAPDARYIGITGTNGKSTTTALIGHILSELGVASAIGGNIGAPALSLDALGTDGVYVLELSSYQLDLLPRAVFDVAVLLNITPDHLDRHGGMDGYVAAKRRIFQGQGSTQTAIVGVDDTHAKSIFDDLHTCDLAALTPISTRGVCAGGIYLNEGWIIDDRGGNAEPIIDMHSLAALPGDHNAQNVATAYGAVTAILETTTADVRTGIVEAIARFPGLAHRQELLGAKGALRFVNDSKATNAEAAAHALSAYENIYWIAGGIAKDGGIAALEPLFDRVQHAFLIGEAADDFEATLEGRVSTTLSGDLANATQQATDMAVGDGNAVVLLSPACASFDQFPSFEARGDAFREAVAAIPGFVPHATGDAA